MWMNYTEFLIIFANIMIDKVLLFPYYCYLKSRNFLYNKGVLKSWTTPVPSICVGNVTVGGTGKTPHVEMILRLLSESDEWGSKTISVLSRGYKRKGKGFQQVTREGSASIFGDEPLQIKKKFPAVTVAVDADRNEGADFLAHPEKLQSSRKARKCMNKSVPAADIIVLDDAFQHRKIKADLNIVLVDYSRNVFTDKFLPMGGLRDLPERIYDADIIIVTKCPSDLDNWERTNFVYSLGFHEYHTSTCEGKNRRGENQTVLFTTISYGGGQKLYSTSDQRYFYSKKLVLFTGIAKSNPLANYLSDYYKIVREYNFPDHHRYVRADVKKLQSAVKLHPTAAVVTTEKDAQRILDYKGMPQNLMERMFYVPISVDFLSDLERGVFCARLAALKRS